MQAHRDIGNPKLKSCDDDGDSWRGKIESSPLVCALPALLELHDTNAPPMQPHSPPILRDQQWIIEPPLSSRLYQKAVLG